MSNSVRFLIEGENLDAASDGDWTICLYRDGRLSAQCGLSGTSAHAFSAAYEVAVENELVEGPSHDEGR